MIIKKIYILVLITVLISGCSLAGPKMLIKQPESKTLRPMGLYVLSSTQFLDNKDLVHRKFVIDHSTDVLSKLLNDKYQIKPLNNKISHDEVFKKYEGSIYIDEKKIAQIAKKEGCGSCLIVYYAVTELNFYFMGVVGALLSEEQRKGDNDMTLHARCSLYGWLISTDDASVLSESHSVLSPFDDYIRDEQNKKQLFQDYVAYMTGITKEMFSPMVTNNN
jgi:hypothetical protein